METRLRPGNGVTRLASDAARAATGQKLHYAPHQGKAERERRMKRLEKANSGE